MAIKLDFKSIPRKGIDNLYEDTRDEITEYMKAHPRIAKGRTRIYRKEYSKIIHGYMRLCLKRIIQDKMAVQLYRLGTLRMVSTKIKKFAPKTVMFEKVNGETIRREGDVNIMNGKPWYYVHWHSPKVYCKMEFKPSKIWRHLLWEARENNVKVLDYTPES